MVTALASRADRHGRSRRDMAMTGEITLRGLVLPVGGIKEKVLAARRAGIREVILPHQNERNINEDISEDLRRDLTVHYVSTVEEALVAGPHASQKKAKKAKAPAAKRTRRRTAKAAPKPRAKQAARKSGVSRKRNTAGRRK